MDRTDDILFSILTDHVKFNETVKYVSEMFEREVFDSAIILNSSGITLSIAGIASLKKDPLIFKDGSLMGKDVPSSKDMKGKRFIIVGDALDNWIRPGTGHLFYKRDAIQKSAEKIKATGDRTVYYGHGKPTKNCRF